MADWDPIYPIDTKTQQINLLPLLPSLSLYFSSFFVGAAWLEDRRWRRSRAVRPARAAHSRPHAPTGSLPSVWGFRSQETSPACPAYHAPGEAPPATCPAYRAHRWRHKVQGGHPLGAGRSLNRLGPTSSDLAPYQVCDLIKHRHCVYRRK
jgi:hypothetical protein